MDSIKQIIKNGSHKIWGNIFGQVVPVIVLIVGLLAVILFSVKQWPIAIALTAVLLSIVCIYLIILKPEFIFIISIIINFSLLGYKLGYLLFIIEMLTLFVIGYVKKIKISIDFTLLLWLGVLLLGLISFGSWGSKYLGLKAYMHLGVMPLLIYIFINNYLNRKQCRWLIKYGFPMVALFIIFSALFVFMYKVARVDNILLIRDFSDFRRLEIPDNGSNRLAGLLIFIAVWLYVSKNVWATAFIKQYSLKILIFISIFLVIVTQSRGAILNLIIALITYYFALYLKGKKIKINIYNSVIAGITLLFLAKPFIEKIIFRFQIAKVDYSNIFRLIMWRDSLLQIKNGLIIGKGPGQAIYSVWGAVHGDPHNMFLRYGVEFGGISLIFIAMILAYPLWIYWQKYKISKNGTIYIYAMFMPPLIGSICHSQIDYIINSYSFGPLFWSLWALMIKALKDITFIEPKSWLDIEDEGE